MKRLFVPFTAGCAIAWIVVLAIIFSREKPQSTPIGIDGRLIVTQAGNVAFVAGNLTTHGDMAMASLARVMGVSKDTMIPPPDSAAAFDVRGYTCVDSGGGVLYVRDNVLPLFRDASGTWWTGDEALKTACILWLRGK